jgi:hypothetical protein
MTTYAIGAAAGDRTFAVQPDGEGAWIIREGTAASGRVDTVAGVYVVTVDDTGAEHNTHGTDLHYAVEAFADLTRTVRATARGLSIAAAWQSPGTVGHVLAELASTGSARIDRLRADAEAVERASDNPLAAADMASLVTYGDGLNPETAWLAMIAMGQILDDVENGHVPADVPTFSALHDYVDANTYGSHFLTTEEAAPMQDAVHAWIVAGGLRQTHDEEAPDPRDGRAHDVVGRIWHDVAHEPNPWVYVLDYVGDDGKPDLERPSFDYGNVDSERYAQRCVSDAVARYAMGWEA